MKRNLLLLCATAATVISASAYSFEAENAAGVNIYYDVNADGVSVSVTYKDAAYGSYSGAVAIPMEVNHDGMDYTVTAIGDHAFDSCYGLSSVLIPSSVNEIGAEAFASCGGLNAVFLPSSVTNIGDGAFKSCMGLFDVKVSRENPDDITLGADVFAGNPLPIATLYVPEDTQDLYKVAPQWKDFDSREVCNSDYFCPNSDDTMIYYNFNDTGTAVAIAAREASASYSGSVTIPASVTIAGVEFPVTAIDNAAFSYCSGLTAVEIPATITSIGEYAFESCGSLSELILPESVKSFGDFAFTYCSSLRAMSIPSSITTISGGAFNYCDKLATVDIPASVTTIGDNAFSYCKALADITIPASVTSLGSYAFSFCSGLQSVKVENPDAAAIALGYNVFYYDPVAEATLYVPFGSSDSYRAAAQWSEFGTIVEMEAGIDGVLTDTPAADGACYDLSGRRVEVRARGFYIIGGRKLLVK